MRHAPGGCRLAILTVDRKSGIRPFVFLKLPGELRNIVYSYLLLPESRIICFNLRASGGRGMPAGIDLHILNTCQKIQKEASNYLTTKNQIEIYICRGFFHAERHHPTVREHLSGWMLDFQAIRTLRVLLNLKGAMSYSDTRVNWGVLKHMTGLEELRVTICVRKRRAQSVMSEPTEKKWRNSWIVNGFVKELVEALPKSVKLEWVGQGMSIDLVGTENDCL